MSVNTLEAFAALLPRGDPPGSPSGWECSQGGQERYVFQPTAGIRPGATLFNRGLHFLAGGEFLIDGDTLQVAPDEEYNAEVRNRDEFDRWTMRRVTGYAEGEPYRLPEPEVDPPEGIESDDGCTVLRRVEDPRRALYFIPDGPRGLRHRPRNRDGESPTWLPAAPSKPEI